MLIEGPQIQIAAAALAWKITVYKLEKGIGMDIVICPGGGNAGLTIQPDGHGIAARLNRHAITGVVLEY